VSGQAIFVGFSTRLLLQVQPGKGKKMPGSHARLPGEQTNIPSLAVSGL
jgi:hypothetical protein